MSILHYTAKEIPILMSDINYVAHVLFTDSADIQQIFYLLYLFTQSFVYIVTIKTCKNVKKNTHTSFRKGCVILLHKCCELCNKCGKHQKKFMADFVKNNLYLTCHTR